MVADGAVFLLSRFLKPRSTDNFIGSEGWKTALKASPQTVIGSLINEGYLQRTQTFEKMECRFTANELKTLLTQRQLAVSGKKSALIQRLIDSDPTGMDSLVEKLEILVCSEKGRQLAEEYLTREKEEKLRIGSQVLQYLKERKLLEAYNLVETFESKQVFPRVMGYDPKREIRVLGTIFKNKPKLLESIGGPELEALRLYAASDFLWGSESPPGLIPLDFKTRSEEHTSELQ